MVAIKFLEDVELEGEAHKQCVTMCQYFHQSVRTISEKYANGTIREYFYKWFFLTRYYAILRRHNYVTPTSYLELILTFKNLLAKKRNEIMLLKQRYVTGLEKLAFAASQVGTKLFFITSQ